MPKLAKPMAQALKEKRTNPVEVRKEPLWKGPEEDGVTYSMLAAFLGCRDRFRVKVIDGLCPLETFSHRMEYGHFFHAMIEGYDKRCNLADALFKASVERDKLMEKYPLQQSAVSQWFHICVQQFPIYQEFWAANLDPTVEKREVVFSERQFSVWVDLPMSGRRVRLRGKIDGIDCLWMKGRKTPELRVAETKTKGDIKPDQILRQLTFDLQTMLYTIAIIHDPAICEAASERKAKITGVNYNLVKRPLSGGKGSIVQHKPTKSNPAGESFNEYMNRLGGVIRENAREFFVRINGGVTPQDILDFRRLCLDPVLENLCDWYDQVTGRNAMPTDIGYQTPMNWRHPSRYYPRRFGP